MKADYSEAVLQARIEIRERLHRYCLALDQRRWEMFDQVFHDDGVCRLAALSGPPLNWRDWLEKASTLLLSATVFTQHQIGAGLIRIEGEVAFTETYVVAHHHVMPDAPSAPFLGGTGKLHNVVVGSRYLDRFEYRSARWLIASRKALSEWRHIRPLSDRSGPIQVL